MKNEIKGLLKRFKEDDDGICMRNLRVLKGLSILSCFVFVTFLIVAFFYRWPFIHFAFYIFGLLESIIITILCFSNVKLSNAHVKSMTFAFVASMLIIAAFTDSIFYSYPSIMFPILIICFPALFLLHPLYSEILYLSATAIFIGFSIHFDTADVALINGLYLSLCLAANLYLNFFLSSLRTQRIKKERDFFIMSHNDALTELPNRRAMKVFEGKNSAHLNIGKTITVFKIDIDNFKKVNDNYGHKYGDEVLIKIAKLFSEFVANFNGIAVREGGEEFVLLLLDITQQQAKEKAEELVQKVYDLKMENITSLGQYVTISMGVSIKTEDTEVDLETLLEEADILLYKAKVQGKNRAICKIYNSKTDIR